MDIFKIQPEHFFKTENEKIRMNWFLFELAVELATEISNSPISKKLKKNGYTVSDINLACITFVKSLKVFILDFLNKKIPQMVIDYRMIEAAFPNLDKKLTDNLLDVSAKAWDSLLSGCCVCPTACLTNRTKKCTFFDEPFYYE